MKIKLVLSVIILILSFFAASLQVHASDGVVEMENADGSGARCYAMSSSTNRSSNFQLLITCRNLIYPLEPDSTFYILWADPIDNNTNAKPFRIGDMEFGERTFTVNKAFTSLTITKEKMQQPHEPSSDVVMEGAIKPIAFLEEEPTPTEIPLFEEEPTPKVTPKVAPKPQEKGGGSSSVVFVIVLIITIVLVVGIIIFIYRKIRGL